MEESHRVDAHPCGDLFMVEKSTVYNNTVFNRFFAENDKAVMDWAENVLAKLEGIGILPTFLKKKDNPDFKAFWGTTTHLFALIVLYARKYKEIDSNKILFELFIQNRGLITNFVDSQEQMEYLFYNYLKEYSKRGRLDIIETEGELLGELLRLIRYNSLDEFIFALLRPESTGWAISSSSPTWNRTDTVLNVTKAYEYTRGVESLSNYPLLIPENISIIQDENNGSGIFNAMTFSGNQTVGIDGRIDKSKLILIDPNLSYEISLFVKVTDTKEENLKFGVVGYESVDGDYFPLGYLDEGVIGYNASLDYKNFDLKANVDITQLTSSSFNISPASPSINPEFGRRYKGNDLPITIPSHTISVKGIPVGAVLSWNANPGLGGKPIILNISKDGDYLLPEMTSVPGTQRAQVLFSLTNCPVGVVITIKQLPVFGESSWFHTSEYLNIPNEGIYYHLKGIVLSNNEKFINAPTLNFENGRALSLLGNMKYIAPIFIQERSQNILGNPYIYLYDFKVKPLYLPFEQGYLGERDIIAAYYKNNAYQEQFSLEVFLENYLIGYKNIFGSELIRPYIGEESYKILFKVFSNRNKYLSNVTIVVNGQTLKTDVNGEAIIIIPRGQWLYKASAENFKVVENILLVEKDAVEYIQLMGDDYERIVTFFVRDKETKELLSNVKVTFAEKTKHTSVSGIASFEVFPGIYQYVAELEDYYILRGSLEVIDSMNVELLMEKIPYYNVTFRVRDGVNPVPGTSILMTGNGIDPQTGSSNAQGLATGFLVVAGTYHYKAVKTGYITKEADFEIAKDSLIDIEFNPVPRYKAIFIVKSNSLPISKVNLTFNGVTLQTDANGRVEFSEIAGTYNWLASKAEFYSQSGQVVLINKDVTTEINLVQIGYFITFNVKDQDNNPVTGASVVIGTETITTSSEGQAAFIRLSGSYNWTVNKTGYYQEQGVVVVNGTDQVVNVTLRVITYNVIFTVRIDGQPVANQPVVLSGQTLNTDGNGIVTFNKSIGNYPWTVSRSGYDTQSGTAVVINQAVSITVDLLKTKGTLITTVVESGSGNPINGAVVTINGESKYTNSNGIAGTWTLVTGLWTWSASATGYYSNSGNLNINAGSNDYQIRLTKEEEPQYEITFIAKESGSPLSSVQIDIRDGSRLTTGFDGTATTWLVRDTYTYTASAGTFFFDIIDSFTVYGKMTIPLNFVRKTTTVTVLVVDFKTSNPIDGASVTFDRSSSTTNSRGEAYFYNIPLSYDNKYTTASKLPLYGEASDYFTVSYFDPTFTLRLGMRLFYIIFTVIDEDGNPIQNVTINVDGGIGYTDFQGKATFGGYQPNTNHEWQAFKDGYTSENGSSFIGEKDVYVNLTLRKLSCMVTYIVKDQNNQPMANVTITDEISVYYTDSSGQASGTHPTGRTYNWICTSLSIFTEKGNYSIALSETTKTVNIRISTDAVHLKVDGITSGTTVTLPILNTGSSGLNNIKVDWGDDVMTIGSISHTYAKSGIDRILFNFQGNSVTMQWSCTAKGNLQLYLVQILKWVSSGLKVSFLAGAFKDCRKLQRIVWGNYGVTSNVTSFFENCTALQSVDRNQFNFPISPASYENAFYGCGMIVDFDLNILAQKASDFSSCFQNSKMGSFSGRINVVTGTSTILSSMFENSSLSSITFDIGTASVTDCSRMFYSCKKLSSPCQINFANFANCNASNFGNSSGFSSIASNSFTGSPNNLDFSAAFSLSTLSSVSSSAFSSLTPIKANWFKAFYLCLGLYNPSGIEMNGLINGESAFELSGITSLPARFLKGLRSDGSSTTIRNMFKDCKNLQTVTAPLTLDTIMGDSYRSINAGGLFRGCTSLTGSIQSIFGQSPNPVNRGSSLSSGLVYKCNNWDWAFENCSKITIAPSVVVKDGGSTLWVGLYSIESYINNMNNNSHVGCFANCTGMLAYPFIPNDWK